MLTSSRSSAICLSLILCATPALGEPGDRKSTEQAQGWTIDVSGDASELPAERVRAVVSEELQRSHSWGAGEIHIEFDEPGKATVTCRVSGAEPRSRRIALGSTPEAALETLALLSVSMVRQDADALAAALGQRDESPQRPENSSEVGAADVPPTDVPPTDVPPTDVPQADGPPTNGPAASASDAPSTVEPGSDAPAKATSERQGAASDASESETAVLKQFPVNLTLWHPLSIIPDSEETRFHFELGLFYSYVGAIDGAGINPFVLRVRENAEGLLVSGIWSDVHGAVDGLSVAGVAQAGRGTLGGAAVSGVFDWRRGSVNGLQVAGVFASAEDVQGAQVGGVLASTKRADGAQIAGVVSLAEPVDGAQIAGVVSLAERVNGAQIAGAVALTGPVDGAQIAGVLASADSVKGAQIAVVNVGETVEGAQIGLVNVGARVKGTQVGLVNVADEVDGFPVGLVNAVGSGRNQAVAWYGGPRMPYNLGLKYLHGPVYTILAVGTKPESDRTVLGSGAGIGGRIPLVGPTFAEVDALWQHEIPIAHDGGSAEKGAHVVRGRAALGIEVTPWLALFGGGGPLWAIEDDTKKESWEPHFFGGVQVF